MQFRLKICQFFFCSRSNTRSLVPNKTNIQTLQVWVQANTPSILSCGVLEPIVESNCEGPPNRMETILVLPGSILVQNDHIMGTIPISSFRAANQLRKRDSVLPYRWSEVHQWNQISFRKSSCFPHTSMVKTPKKHQFLSLKTTMDSLPLEDL